MKIGIITWSCRFALGCGREDQAGIPGCISFPAFVEQAAALGLDGIMAETNYLADESEYPQLRRLFEKHNLYLEIGGWGCSPDALKNQLRIARLLGSRILRTAILGRGRFLHSPAERRQMLREAEKNLCAILPEAEKYRIAIAIENHQDFTAPELLGVVRRVESEYCGICFDTGNSIPILQDPYRECRLLAPYVKTVHFKDFQIADTDRELTGARLYGTALGDGVLDLPREMRTIFRAAPEANWNIELQLGPGSTPEETYRREEAAVVRSIAYARNLQKTILAETNETHG